MNFARIYVIFRQILAFLLLTFSHSVGAQNSIVADVSSYYVDISTRFSGTQVLIYGAADRSQGDVIIIVKGPHEDFFLDQKKRIAGVWLKGSSVHYANVPRFYHIVSATDVARIASPSARETYQLELNALNINGVATNSDISASDEKLSLRTAFIEQMKKQGLYFQSADRLNWLGTQLFRAELIFPSNVAAGTYILETYYLRDGYVVSAQALPLFIRKSGILGVIFSFAHAASFLYGVLAILLAASLGFLGYWHFRE